MQHFFFFEIGLFKNLKYAARAAVSTLQIDFDV